MQRSALRPFVAVVAAVAATVLSVSCAAGRPPEDEINRIAELMSLRAGMRVADVGAGDGEYSEALALRVGAAGHVYSTEVEEDDVEDIRDRLERIDLENTTALLGDQDDTGLPADCCDGVLLRLVYHHFTEPAKMRASLRRALRRGAPLVVIDITPQTHWGKLDDVPERGGHGITPERLIEEMSADGFEVVARYDDWPDEDDHFCVVFVATDE